MRQSYKLRPNVIMIEEDPKPIKLPKNHVVIGSSDDEDYDSQEHKNNKQFIDLEDAQDEDSESVVPLPDQEVMFAEM